MVPIADDKRVNRHVSTRRRRRQGFPVNSEYFRQCGPAGSLRVPVPIAEPARPPPNAPVEPTPDSGAAELPAPDELPARALMRQSKRTVASASLCWRGSQMTYSRVKECEGLRELCSRLTVQAP